MRSLLLKIHLYGGLLCSSYFVIFGVSSLNFNHHFAVEGTDKVEWERTITLPAEVDPPLTDSALADAVRDSLGFAGWPWTWTIRRNDAGVLHFRMSRPGRLYDLDVVALGAGPQARVTAVETRTGLWSIVGSLHGLMQLPNSAFVSAWGLYTELCFWVVIFSAATGVYLWTRRRSERLVGTWLFAGVSGSSVAFMLYVYWVG